MYAFDNLNNRMYIGFEMVVFKLSIAWLNLDSVVTCFHYYYLEQTLQLTI